VCHAALCLLATCAAIFSYHGGAAGEGGPGGAPRNFLEDDTLEALENLRAGMTEGWPELGIPPLDPLLVPEAVFNIYSEETHVYGTMTNVTINKLSTFTIDLVDTDLHNYIKVDIVLGLPLLDFRGDYDMLGEIDVIPVYGEGEFWMDAMNTKLNSSVDLQGLTEDSFFGVSQVNLDSSCNQTDIHFENIMGGGDMEDFVNGVLSSLGLDFLAALEDQYMPLLEEALRHELNVVLQARGGGQEVRVSMLSPGRRQR